MHMCAIIQSFHNADVPRKRATESKTEQTIVLALQQLHNIGAVGCGQEWTVYVPLK